MGIRFSADLAVTKQDSPDPVFIGNNLTYTIPVTNNGPFLATGVTLIDTLPAGVTFVSANPSQGSCTETGGVVTCSLGTLANGASATVGIVVTPTAVGTITNTASVSGNEFDPDPANNTDTETTTVQPTIQTFTNPTPIIIPDSGPATPYPSSINVAGLPGTVFEVTATLHNLSHTFLDDLEILLVGPGGQNVILMDDVGGGGPGVVNATYTFDDNASGSMTPSTIPPSGTYQPSNDGSLENLPLPAPQQPPSYGTVLSVFNGTNPNGTWSLFVNDAASGDSGSIAGGWSLTITVG